MLAISDVACYALVVNNIYISSTLNMALSMVGTWVYSLSSTTQGMEWLFRLRGPGERLFRYIADLCLKLTTVIAVFLNSGS